MKQPEDTVTLDIEDIFVWPDGGWCYRYERNEMQHKSDDHTILYVNTIEYVDFFENLLGE